MRGAAYIRSGSPSFIDCVFEDNWADREGGGLSLHNVNAVVTRCDFIGNTSFSESTDTPVTAHGNGGGLHIFGSDVIVTDCYFTQNFALGWGDSGTNTPTAGNGAALLNFNSGGTFTNCVFYDNTSEAYGAGVLNQNGADPVFVNCHFDSNKALGEHWWESGGAGINNWFCSPTFIDCTVTNHTSDHGGGIHSHNATQTFIRCLVADNHAEVDPGGGAYLADSDSYFEQCVFINNTASRGAGAYARGPHEATFENCLFANNTAQVSGAALYMASGMSLSLINSTVTRNTAVTSNTGGVYHLSDGDLLVENSILYDNTDNGGQFQRAQIEVVFGDYAVNYSCVQGLSGSLVGVENFSGDPMFVAAAAGDFRIAGDSPCVNTGNPAVAPAPDVFDLANHPRVLCNRVDVGAYEYGMGDTDCDLDVDLFDYGAWGDCVTGPGGGAAGSCVIFDFDADGDVDLMDYREFQLMFAGS
jgi:predicted outer membrane repeat protein